MSVDNASPEELLRLLVAYTSGAASDEQFEDLEELLDTSEAARAFYVKALDVHAGLYWYRRRHAVEVEVLREVTGQSGTESSTYEESLAAFLIPDTGSSAPRVDQAAPRVQPSILAPTFPAALFHSTLGYPSLGWPVAYLAATVIFGIGLWIGAITHVSHPVQFAEQRSTVAEGTFAPEPSMESVGRITGTLDCKWARGSNLLLNNDVVSLGRELKIESGLVKITYNTGATVILQGPVAYVVESKDGGYLSLGKLTAKLEKAEGERRKAEEGGNQKSEIRNQKSPFPLPPPPFVVRTPTATVTDLGTEFGVSVDKSGATIANVFRGVVEVRAASAEKAIRLTENQSARVQRDERLVLVLSRSQVKSEAFVRRMPPPFRRAAVEVFNTGAGVREGDPDPHWQIVAASNDPNFQPRAAIVTAFRPGGWLDNETGLSQWVSLAAREEAPNGVVYTFRTTFDLAGAAPETAVLNGWFAVDNHVRAIRLNGNRVSVPEHRYDESFSRYYGFAVRGGFVAGTNVLEIDVENGSPGHSEPSSPMALRVDLEATALSRQPGKDP